MMMNHKSLFKHAALSALWMVATAGAVHAAEGAPGALNDAAKIQSVSPVAVVGLRCGNLCDPLGIESPSFGWKLDSAAENVTQTAYEIELASTPNLLNEGAADVWKSGKVSSDRQFQIKPPEGILSNATPYSWRVRVWDGSDHMSAWSKPAAFTTGLSGESAWQAKWITRIWNQDSTHPYFRKVVNLEAKDGARPVNAIVYLCGLGSGELYFNGAAVDPTRLLDPAISNYEQYAFYSTFDVFPLLREGDNCIGVMLGKGWFTQDEVWAPGGLPYGDPMLRLQMVVIYADGTRKVIGSDESWLWKDGPVVNSNVYHGEVYDARREVSGWATVDASDDGWQPSVPATIGVPPRLTAQTIAPIRTLAELPPVKHWRDPAGNWIFDFGVNVSAVLRLEVEQPSGTHLVLRMAEETKPDGSLDHSSYSPQLVGEQKDEYICKGGGREIWSPRFTYHGFRYAELVGLQGEPQASTLKALFAHTDLPIVGDFECSDEQINRLHTLAVRTALSNLHGIPEDCPQREKGGWLGDASAWMKMSACNFDVQNFWRKYLEDIRSSGAAPIKNALFHERMNNTFYHADKPAGLPLMLAPGKRFCGVASPIWGSTSVQLPWYLYLYYGDVEVLGEYYGMMKQWVEHIAATAKDPARTKVYNEKGDTQHIVYQGLGDWCPPGFTQDSPIELFSTMFHFHDVSTMEKIACIIHKEPDSEAFGRQKKLIQTELLDRFYNAEKKTFGSQAADALALDFGLVPVGDEQAVSAAIVRNMNEKYDGFMHVGNQGNSRIGSALARHGNSQAAFNLFTKRGKNSYEWMWKTYGATSLWEVLPVNDNGGLSRNHPAQGGYDVFFYEDVAGIRPEPSAPGYKTIRFEPQLMDQLDWAKATIATSYGKVMSDWKKAQGRIVWHIAIPANANGLVALPKDKKIRINESLIDEAKYPVAELNQTKKIHRFPSGTFSITIE